LTAIRNHSHIPLIAIAAIVIAGCGGGTTNPEPAPTAKTHILADGDQWQYSLTGSEVLGGTNFTLNGTDTQVVSKTTLNGTPVLAITTTDDFLANGQHITVSDITYESQDPVSGDLKLVADTRGPNNSLRTVTGDQVVNKGTFGAGFTSKATITFDNGDTQTDNVTVEGHTFVTVPSGTYNTWQEAVTKNDTNGQLSNDVEWWAPEIGGFVKENVNGSQPGFEIHITLALLSTTVVPPTPSATPR